MEEVVVALTQPTKNKLAQARVRIGLPEETKEIVGRIAQFTTRGGDEIAESTIGGTHLSDEYGVRLFPERMVLEAGHVRYLSFDQWKRCWCAHVDGRSVCSVPGDLVML